jgi:hypothetical protein
MNHAQANLARVVPDEAGSQEEEEEEAEAEFAVRKNSASVCTQTVDEETGPSGRSVPARRA